ncbi:MAG: type sorting protein [Ignavibacteria bacterium]|nr:type sorting protein [Ignavibacteria bacterium]
MKTLIYLLVLIFSLTSVHSEVKMKMFIKDGFNREFYLNDIIGSKYLKPSNECIMKIYCKDNYIYFFHIKNIDTFNLYSLFDNQKALMLKEKGYEYNFILAKTDSIVFNYNKTAPIIDWSRKNSSGINVAQYGKKIKDGGFVFGGRNTSSSNQYIWIVRLDSNGYILWQKQLVYYNNARCRIILETNDNGFIVGGSAYTYKNNTGSYNWFVVKLDSLGNIEWDKTIGSTWTDEIRSIYNTEDGGFIAAGDVGRNDGDVIGNYNDNIWLVKFNSLGNIVWQHSIGGSSDENLNSFIKTNDKGYILAGRSSSKDGDVSGNHGNYDFWIVKLDSNCNMQWQKCYGGSDYDEAIAILQTKDGGYIAGGHTKSKNGDATGNHGYYDILILKLDTSGKIQWKKTLGGTGLEMVSSIIQSDDGGYFILGTTTSSDFDVTGYEGLNDFWVIKLDSTGNIQWETALGGTNDDNPNSLFPSKDGGCVIFGYSNSNDRDITIDGKQQQENRGCWIVKLDSIGKIVWQKSLCGTGFDNPIFIKEAYDETFYLGGTTQGLWVARLVNSVDNPHTDTLQLDMSDSYNVKFNIDNIQKITFEDDSDVMNDNPNSSNFIIIDIYPNPADDYMNIAFELGKPGDVNIKIYDLTGRQINNLEYKGCTSGKNILQWNGFDSNGYRAPFGVYFIEASLDKEVLVKKFILLN